MLIPVEREAVLLTITTTHRPATDLGYLLHKHPDRVQSFPLSFGVAHVFYPEASEERCTAALSVEVDPIALVRGRRTGDGLLDQYVNDRPYAASSFLSVALAGVFGSALAGRSKERADLIDLLLPLETRIAALPCRGGEGVLRRLFEPLGYQITAEGSLLDERFPEWGPAPYFSVTLTGRTRLQDLLRHLYVLIPVLDDEKHYWVGEEEVEKLLRHGEGWLAAHPARDLIAFRYLHHRRRLVNAAVARLTDDAADPDVAVQERAAEEAAVEEHLSLHTIRLAAVLAVLKAGGARRVLDLGCGEGRLLKLLLADEQFQEIVGVDVSSRALDYARERLNLDALPPDRQARIRLLQGAITYRDRRLEGFDAAALVEVIEHLDLSRLAAFERTVFAFARPATVVLTTPNVEYNVNFASLPAGQLRHRDHRFEWTRAQFAGWANDVAARFGYDVVLAGIGPEDAVLGPPTQMATFCRQPTKETAP